MGGDALARSNGLAQKSAFFSTPHVSASADEARRNGMSNVTCTCGKRGVVVCSDRSGSAVLGDATGRLGTAGREDIDVR